MRHSSSLASGAASRYSGASLGSVKPEPGVYFDRNELPRRFHRGRFSELEIEAIETGGASLVT